MNDLKLTSETLTTRGNTSWSLNTWVSAPNPSSEAFLCTDSWIHFYHDLSPEFAVVVNPIHADFQNPRLFEVEVDQSLPVKNEPLKSGAKRLKLIRELPVPEVPLAARVRFAIYTSQAILRATNTSIPEWEAWATHWLDGSDRTPQAAEAAVAEAAEAAAAWTAAAAAWTAEVAARAAARAAAWAVERASLAAWKAEARTSSNLNLNELLAKAIKDENE